MTKKIAFEVPTETFEQLIQSDWRETAAQQDKLETFLKQATFNQATNADSTTLDVLRILRRFTDPDCYQPLAQDTSLAEWIRDAIIDELGNGWTDDQIIAYRDELALYLFDGPNASGSYFCNAYKTRNWITTYAEELSYYTLHMELLSVDPIQHPESYHVIVIMELAAWILESDVIQSVIDEFIEMNQLPAIGDAESDDKATIVPLAEQLINVLTNLSSDEIEAIWE